MNKDDRKRVNAVLAKLVDLRSEIEALKEGEESKLEGLPGGLSQSMKATAFQEATDALYESLDAFDQLHESLSSIASPST